MKKVASLVLTALVAASLFSVMACSSASGGDSADTLPAAPPAVAANDSTSLGVYKGVIADTSVSGSFWVELSKTPASPSVMSSRGTAPMITSAVLNILINGSYQQIAGTISGLALNAYHVTFSGFAIGGKATTFSFSVSSDAVTDASLDITGSATAEIALYKELSDTSVSSWEGTFSGADGGGGTMSGIWNSISTNTDMLIVYSGTDVNGGSRTLISGHYIGEITSSTVNVDTGLGGPETIGTISSTTLTGSWDWPKEPSRGSGTWSGKKTQ